MSDSPGSGIFFADSVVFVVVTAGFLDILMVVDFCVDGSVVVVGIITVVADGTSVIVDGTLVVVDGTLAVVDGSLVAVVGLLVVIGSVLVV